MAITPLTLIIAEAKLADLARHQRHVDHTAWADAAPPAPPAVRPAPTILWRSRWRLGSAMIRLGNLIAGPARPSLASGPPYHQA